MPRIHVSDYWWNGNAQSWSLWCWLNGELHCTFVEVLNPWKPKHAIDLIMCGQCLAFHIYECFHIKRLACTYRKLEMLNLLGLSLCNFIDLVYTSVHHGGCYSHLWWKLLEYSPSWYWLDVIITDYYMHDIYGLKCEFYSCRFLKFIKLMVVHSIYFLPEFYVVAMVSIWFQNLLIILRLFSPTNAMNNGLIMMLVHGGSNVHPHSLKIH